jgi:hypothetical protein
MPPRDKLKRKKQNKTEARHCLKGQAGVQFVPLQTGRL